MTTATKTKTLKQLGPRQIATMVSTGELLTVEAARARLGINKARAYQLVELGRVDSVRAYGRVFVTAASVDKRLADEARVAERITTVEVAEFFGVNERTVRGWVKDGLLPAESTNNILIHDLADIVAFRPPHLTEGVLGRPPLNQATRMIRGQHYPLPASAE